MRTPAIAGFALLLVCIICFAGVPMKEVDKATVLSAGPQWQENYDKSRLDPEQISLLKAEKSEDLRVDIYLGLWCPDSQRNVPPFIKIMESIGSGVPVRFISVQRKPDKTIKYYVDEFRIERVPTFVFYRGDREIGRIVENPAASLAEDTIEILSK